MLKTIQIVALLQGIFLLFILFKHKNEYKKTNFWLLFGCIISVLLYALGDDDYNLFVKNSDWFWFHDTLIITFFFLFVRYHKSEKKEFATTDYLFFIPYGLNISFELLKIENNPVFNVFKELIELTFAVMLLYTIYDIIKSKKEKWLLVFIIPLTIIFIIDEFTFITTGVNASPYFLDSYGVILMAIFLFYFVLYKLIITPKDVLPKADLTKYKTSNLTTNSIAPLKDQLITLMTDEKLFKNQKLTVNDVAKKLGVPRQQISELLNVYMQIGFQDFLNQYRVEEFTQSLTQEKYKNYTLLAIANEVGFSSKSSFNTTFKKLKGVTPSQYKKQLNTMS